MAGYAAVVSLVQFLHTDQYPLLFRTPEIESLYTKARALQSSLDKIFRSPIPKTKRATLKDLDIKIRDDIYRALDIIEAVIFKQNPTCSPTFQQEVQGVIESIGPAEAVAKDIADSIVEDDPETDGSSSGDAAAASSVSASSGQPPRQRIFGQEEDFANITAELNKENSSLQILPVIGLPGIGKTTLARSIYDDIEVQKVFTTRAWVTVSQESQLSEILIKLLNSMDTKVQKAGETVIKAGATVSELTLQLHQKLFSAKYLVVVDDMWEEGVWDKVKQSLPDEKNGSRIILTTRLATIADYATKKGAFRCVVKPLNEENSWALLCDKAFGGGPALDFLEKTGKLISKNCGGIPLLLTVIGGLLFRERQTEEYWETIREDTYAAAALGEGSYSEILSLSYNHLPGKLKGCFLYMGGFPEDSEILVTKIIRLWVAEGFLKLTKDQRMGQDTESSPQLQSPEQVAEEFLKDLIMRNLLSIRKLTSNGFTKAFGMHDSLRDLSMKECRKEKFFHAINKYIEKDQLPEGAGNQRRLSVHKNILVCMKDVYESAKSISSARTLLYAGPHHHHPLPFSLTFDLLRVLDALTVYFIEFPNEIVELIHLRFLSLTYNGKLPSSISRLQKLQVLILHRNPKIIFIGSSYLPAEIWNMPELRHLLFMESELPHPSECSMIPTNKSVLLQHLRTLASVNAASCPRDVIKNMPNLRKLGMWVEKPGPVGLYLDELEHLESFKFTVLNPSPRANVDFLPPLYFPKMLKKLTLSGCGISWDDMAVIGKLKCLEVLKLRELAFKGEVWEPEEDEFRVLKYLLLEYVDLKCWVANHENFPSLQSLNIRHCYELEEMYTEISAIGGLELIEMIDCSPYAVTWAKEIAEMKKNDKKLRVRIYTSWE